MMMMMMMMTNHYGDDGGGDLDHSDDNCYYLIFAEKASKDIQFPVLVSSVGDSKLFLQPVIMKAICKSQNYHGYKDNLHLIYFLVLRFGFMSFSLQKKRLALTKT